MVEQVVSHKCFGKKTSYYYLYRSLAPRVHSLGYPGTKTWSLYTKV